MSWLFPSSAVLNSTEQTQTYFDIKVEELGLLTFEEMTSSIELKRWVEQNANRYYVPERLIKKWNIHVIPSFT